MKIIGTISRDMFNKQNNKFISHTDLQLYTAPIESIASIDIGRLVYLSEDGKISIESYKHKSFRDHKTFLLDLEENKPIINNTEH